MEISSKILILDDDKIVTDTLKNVMYIEGFEDDMVLDVFYEIGFSDEQISYLGFDHLFGIEEE